MVKQAKTGDFPHQQLFKSEEEQENVLRELDEFRKFFRKSFQKNFYGH